MNDEIPLHRMTVEMSVYYAELLPEAVNPHTPVLLVLHGFGQRSDRFIRQFAPLQEGGILVVAPQAPHPFYVKMQPRIVGFTWLTRFERDQAVQDVVLYLDRLLDELARRHHVDAHRLFLLGFSQGVSMAYRYAVYGRQPVSGLIACSADLPPDVVPHLSRRRFPVLLCHGRSDEMAPVRLCEEAAQTLEMHGYSREIFLFEGGHEVTPEVVNRAGRWIYECLRDQPQPN